MSTILIIPRRGYLTELTYCFCHHLINKGKFELRFGDRHKEKSFDSFKCSIVSSFLNKKPTNKVYNFLLNGMYIELYDIEKLIAWKNGKAPRPFLNIGLDFKNKLRPAWQEWLTIRGHRGLNLKSIAYFKNLARVYLYS